MIPNNEMEPSNQRIILPIPQEAIEVEQKIMQNNPLTLQPLGNFIT